MSTLKFPAVIAALFLASVVGVLSAHAQTATEPASQPAPAPFRPSFGDFMDTLVQPRHIKLGLIGRAQNWTLAAYEIHQLKAALTNIAKWQPLFGTIPVAAMMATTVDPPIADLEKAVQARDPQQFNEAYARLTSGCNSCHAALHHGDVVIQEPDASTFPDQNFNPKR